MPVMVDLRVSNVDFITQGQYLQPIARHAAVESFVPPEAFADYARVARSKGFLMVASSPLTHSSYHANADFAALRHARQKRTQTDSAGWRHRHLPDNPG